MNMFSETIKFAPRHEKKIGSQPEKSVLEKSPVFKFEMFTDHEQRRLLGEAADELVEHVAVVEKQGLEDPKKRVVVFLDKSARPLSTLFREM